MATKEGFLLDIVKYEGRGIYVVRWRFWRHRWLSRRKIVAGGDPAFLTAAWWYHDAAGGETGHLGSRPRERRCRVCWGTQGSIRYSWARCGLCLKVRPRPQRPLFFATPRRRARRAPSFAPFVGSYCSAPAPASAVRAHRVSRDRDDRQDASFLRVFALQHVPRTRLDGAGDGRRRGGPGRHRHHRGRRYVQHAALPARHEGGDGAAARGRVRRCDARRPLPHPPHARRAHRRDERARGELRRAGEQRGVQVRGAALQRAGRPPHRAAAPAQGAPTRCGRAGRAYHDADVFTHSLLTGTGPARGRSSA